MVLFGCFFCEWKSVVGVGRSVLFLVFECVFVFLGGGLVSRSMSFGMFLFGVVVFVLGSWVFVDSGFLIVFFVGGFLFLVVCGGGGW